MDFYIQGLTLGLAYVAPIGMQNLFVINSALTQPRWRALLTALIVIFFDITLAMACFFGIGLIMQKYAAGTAWHIAAGRTGSSIYRRKPVKKQRTANWRRAANAAWQNRMAGVCGNVVQRAGRYRRHYAFGRV